MNVSELSVRNLERRGERDSLYFSGRWYTNREMLDRSVRSAAGLAWLGVQRGDRVATVLANCPEVLNTFVACFWMGAWCMPVMFSLSAEEMGYLFEDAQPTVVVTQVSVPRPGSRRQDPGGFDQSHRDRGPFPGSRRGVHAFLVQPDARGIFPWPLALRTRSRS